MLAFMIISRSPRSSSEPADDGILILTEASCFMTRSTTFASTYCPATSASKFGLILTFEDFSVKCTVFYCSLLMLELWLIFIALIAFTLGYWTYSETSSASETDPFPVIVIYSESAFCLFDESSLSSPFFYITGLTVGKSISSSLFRYFLRSCGISVFSRALAETWLFRGEVGARISLFFTWLMILLFD